MRDYTGVHPGLQGGRCCEPNGQAATLGYFSSCPPETRHSPMINSMTAFARESLATDNAVLTVEVRTVNHRYLDCTFKLPDSLRPLENALRERAGSTLARGKLDCLIRVQAGATSVGSLNINSERLAAVLQAARQVSAEAGDVQALNPLELLQFPGVCGEQEHSEEELFAQVESLFTAALSSLVENRQREGEKLAGMIRERLVKVGAAVEATRSILPALMQQQRERILTRINELDVEADEGRIEQELVLQAQKADVDEELDRLEAHIGEVERALDKGGPCGRRLDFLMQELNREANTLSSKSVASSTTQNAVELKVLIEQMREQIQNIE